MPNSINRSINQTKLNVIVILVEAAYYGLIYSDVGCSALPCSTLLCSTLIDSALL